MTHSPLGSCLWSPLKGQTFLETGPRIASGGRIFSKRVEPVAADSGVKRAKCGLIKNFVGKEVVSMLGRRLQRSLHHGICKTRPRRGQKP